MISRILLVVALSLMNILAHGRQWNFVHYNYCSDNVTLVFSQDLPVTGNSFNFPPASSNGGRSTAYITGDGFDQYYTTVTAVKGNILGRGPYAASGSSVEFNFQGQYDITSTSGWNYPLFIQIGQSDGSGACTLAQCNSYNTPQCKDYYAHDSGLASDKRQGSDTQVPNHYCAPQNNNTIQIQTCGQDAGRGRTHYLFGKFCGQNGCAGLTNV